MSALIKSDIILEVCDKGCGGLWFDHAELDKITDLHASAGQALLDTSARARLPVDVAAKRPCPRCRTVVMQRHFFSVRQDIEVDECGACGGIWLDAGELAAIRRQFKTAQERKQAADVYFSRLLDRELEAEAKRGAARAQATRKFARALRFICPSHWIPGKQEWGAF
jgi:Zn-finger nucleic acid-binding protein